MEESEKEYEEDVQTVEKYWDRYPQLKREKLNTPQIPFFEIRNESLERRRSKLPKIELKKFNGDAKICLSFWSQCQKFQEDKVISDSDKFQYFYKQQFQIPKQQV